MSKARIVVGPGENVATHIDEFLKLNKWKQAVILGAVGSARDIKVATIKSMDFPPVDIQEHFFEGPAEIVSFIGEVIQNKYLDPTLRELYPGDDEDNFIHLHVSVALRDGRVVGGGLHQIKAFREVVVFLGNLDDR